MDANEFDARKDPAPGALTPEASAPEGPTPEPPSNRTAAVVTVSDRASTGVYDDKSGPVVADCLVAHGYEVVRTVVVPDDRGSIEGAIAHAAYDDIALLVTTGGTGFSPRDVTPEATAAACERMVPGIPEAMRAASMRVTSRACLSRAAAGIRGRTLVVNLPGSPKAAVENLESVIAPIAHGLDVLRGGVTTCAR